MSAAKHMSWHAEPAPGRISVTPTHRLITLAPNGIDTVTIAHFGGPDGERNATLAAAAPELLAAAQVLWANFNNGYPVTVTEIEQIESVIAKATGSAS